MAPARSCGTARWAYSNSRRSPPARVRSPRRSASRTASRTSRRRAAPSSSSSKVARCRRSRHWKRAPDFPDRPRPPYHRAFAFALSGRFTIMPRATEIVATLGPASSSPDVLARLIHGGVDVVRLNFSHGVAADHVARASAVREAAKAQGREVAVMADLQGPKIRIGKFKDGKVDLAAGQK